MFSASKKVADLQQRFDEQAEVLAQYRKAIQRIAVHAGVDIGVVSNADLGVSLICDAIDQLSGNPSRKVEPGKEDRPVPATIRNIKLGGCVDVVVIQGDTPNLSVRCSDKAFLPKVLTSVSGNTLTIGSEPTLIMQHGCMNQIFEGSVQIFNGSNAVIVDGDIVKRGRTTISMSGGPLAEITVVLPCVSGLRIKGAGKVSYRGFSLDEINLEISGSGNIDLEGTADRLEADISGSGDVSAFGLIAKSAKLRISGSGDIRTTVTENVRARVSGSGKIKVAGSPAQRDTDVSGSGKIKFVTAD